jgi:transposase
MAPDSKPETKKPAKAAKKGEVNKSEEIRKVANGMKAKGEKPRPVVIIEILKKQGVEVSSPQVSMVLKRMGFRPRKRRKNGAGATRAAAGSTATKATKIKIEDLVKAQKVAAQMGGIDRAVAALQALRGFEG